MSKTSHLVDFKKLLGVDALERKDHLGLVDIEVLVVAVPPGTKRSVRYIFSPTSSLKLA
jgi:hypothetical protein